MLRSKHSVPLSLRHSRLITAGALAHEGFRLAHCTRPTRLGWFSVAAVRSKKEDEWVPVLISPPPVLWLSTESASVEPLLIYTNVKAKLASQVFWSSGEA